MTLTKKEEDLTGSPVLEADIIRGLLDSTKESILITIPNLRTRLNAPAQSFAGVVTFDSNVIVDGAAQLNTTLGVAGIATFADDLIIADGKTIGQAAGPKLTFDDTNDYLEITQCQVIIGGDIPDGTLHVHTDTAGTVAPAAAGDDLIVENSAGGGISILTPDASNSNLYFGSPSDNVGASVSWNYDDKEFSIASREATSSLLLKSGNNVEQIRIEPDGGIFMNNLLAAAPGSLKQVYYDTATKELSYDNT